MLRVMKLIIKTIVFTCIFLSFATKEIKGSKYLLIDVEGGDTKGWRTIEFGKYYLVAVNN